MLGSKTIKQTVTGVWCEPSSSSGGNSYICGIMGFWGGQRGCFLFFVIRPLTADQIYIEIMKTSFECPY